METYDDRSALRRALDALPHAVARRLEREIIDAADEYARSGDPSTLNRLVLSAITGGVVETDPEFRAAVAWSDAHPERAPRPMPNGGLL